MSFFLSLSISLTIYLSFSRSLTHTFIYVMSISLLIGLFEMGQFRPLFVYFPSFHMRNIALTDYNDKSVDGVLGTRTRGLRGGRMVGADESTEL